jgi:SAM-dependent MidA family methyltransferase
MDLALYDPESGYYARAARRSGRAGDFFTSVDIGPIFGELLAVQIAEMAEILEGGHTRPPLQAAPLQIDVGADPRVGPLDIVEAGAGNGRLAADLLQSLRRHWPGIYERVRLHLVESSAHARAAQPGTLADVADRLASSESQLPSSFEGVLLANELLDAMPVHQVVMRDDGLREVYVVTVEAHDAARPVLTTIEGPPSTPALAKYLSDLDATLEPGWRAEINLRARDWIRTAARRLRRGFIIVIDYGHEARELYSVTHTGGTLATFARHTMRGAEAHGAAPAWLVEPGERDITAHVDFTSIRAAAESEGLQTIGFLDQTYFLLGLLGVLEDRQPFSQSAIESRPHDMLRSAILEKGARPLKTLIMPGGLGSTHKVMILGKGVGTPRLRGCSYRARVT